LLWEIAFIFKVQESNFLIPRNGPQDKIDVQTELRIQCLEGSNKSKLHPSQKESYCTMDLLCRGELRLFIRTLDRYQSGSPDSF